MATWLAYPTWLNPGDNAWQMTAATLVGLMSVPGLVVLYGGVMQKRWSVNSMMLAFVAFALVLMLWVLFGSRWPSASRCTSSARRSGFLGEHLGQAGLDPEREQRAGPGADPADHDGAAVPLPDRRRSPTSSSSSRRSRRS